MSICLIFLVRPNTNKLIIYFFFKIKYRKENYQYSREKDVGPILFIVCFVNLWLWNFFLLSGNTYMHYSEFKKISSTIEGFNKFSFTKKKDILYLMKKNSIMGNHDKLYKHVWISPKWMTVRNALLKHYKHLKWKYNFLPISLPGFFK